VKFVETTSIRNLENIQQKAHTPPSSTTKMLILQFMNR